MEWSIEVSCYLSGLSSLDGAISGETDWHRRVPIGGG
jgi:hypothetical protein